MTFIFRNRTIFWDISKWNRGQTKWDGGSISHRGDFFPRISIFSFLSFEVELLIFCLLALFKLSKFIVYTRIFHQ